jgi:2-(1,2-epoxy-1,2-dihydrophenyl)acetyl-CoA isomerase
MKENLARALTSADVHDCLDLEASHHIHCGGTADHKNAVEAFIAKRAPVFEGK